jgi:hypothetical protein
LSAEAFQSLSIHLEKHTQQWLTQDQLAQLNRNVDPSVMDIYDTATVKGMHMNMNEQASYKHICAGPSPSDVQEILISGEGGDPLAHGQTSWIAFGIRIQHLQYVLCSEHCICANNVCVDWLSGMS